MIAIVDYGVGNLGSVEKALSYLGAKVEITGDAAVLARASHVILPGVGAFAAGMAALSSAGLVPALRQAAAEKPLLGICLGMQMFFAGSTEFGHTEGLGFFPAEIVYMDWPEKVPHVGWNQVEPKNDCPLFAGIGPAYYYFVHSYCAADAAAPYVAGVTEYERPFASAVWNGNVFATQFHPEKSGEAGLALLKNFISL